MLNSCLVLDPPANVRISEITKSSVSLVWQKPPFDGGSKITGYMVERREAPNGRWTKANFTNVIETNFNVSGLTQNESYEFRVFAKNAVGSVSNPSLIAGPVTCVDVSGEYYTFHTKFIYQFLVLSVSVPNDSVLRCYFKHCLYTSHFRCSGN